MTRVPLKFPCNSPCIGRTFSSSLFSGGKRERTLLKTPSVAVSPEYRVDGGIDICKGCRKQKESFQHLTQKVYCFGV